MDNVPVRMDRGHVEDLPVWPVPAPYRLRWYQPGDEDAWVRVHLEADAYNAASEELFRSQFGHDATVLAQRQAYLLDEPGSVIGTASAWRDADDSENWGRVHWVAIVPAHQGKGLAKPLMAAILSRLRDLGHSKLYLTTSSARLPAINLYLKLGFVPAVRSAEERAAWLAVAEALGRALPGIEA